MNPDQFHDTPEDVKRDAELRASDEALKVAEETAAKIKKARELANEAASHAIKNRVQVSVTERGRIRRNGPCPCGSGSKFKTCCLTKINAGEKKRVPPALVRAFMKGQK